MCPPILQKKKKKKRGKKKPVGFLPFVNEVPVYKDPFAVCPKVKLMITFVNNIENFFSKKKF